MFKLGPRNLAALGVVALAPAAAHHSYVIFNQNVTTNVDAVVSTWQFTNPHGKLWIYIYDASGKPQLWALEAPGPAQLLQHGWDKYTVKPGEKMKISFHPLRNGSHGGSLVEIILPDGRQFDTGASPGGSGNGGRGGFGTSANPAGK